VDVAPDPEAVPILSIEQLRLRNNPALVIVTLGISYSQAMRPRWSRTVLVSPSGVRQAVGAELVFSSPLDAPAAVTLSLDTEVAVLPGSWLSFAAG